MGLAASGNGRPVASASSWELPPPEEVVADGPEDAITEEDIARISSEKGVSGPPSRGGSLLQHICP